jgi:Mrp family chromosome partitioning ATPase
VLLVDLDLRNPGIMRAFGGMDQGTSPAPHQGPLSDNNVQHLPGLNLDYLPIRRSRTLDPVALFARADIANLLGRLREGYDFVLVDSAPLLATTEARLLAAMADRILFVVKWGSTRHDEARAAIDMLRNGGFLNRDSAALTSVVVNQIDLKSHVSYRYGYTPYDLDGPRDEGALPARLSEKSSLPDRRKEKPR